MANVLETTTPFWWPLDLSPRETEAVSRFRRRMLEAPVILDKPLAESVANQLFLLMRQHVAQIIAGDSLPHLGHILNGWGDALFQGRRMMHRLDSFIHLDAGEHYFILQRDPEGEFHPWQGIAYAVMAGVDPDETVPPGVTLRELGNNSRYLYTRDGFELGHLLFALAYLEPDLNARPFSLAGNVCDVPTLMQMAVDAHHYGSFEVCRKFHLTEGLCAMAALVTGLDSYRDDAQGFLNGQLEMLLLLGVILQEARALAESGRNAEPGSLIQELRETLVMGNYLENHCYYAGHIVELAMFAESVGYQIAPEHKNAMAFVLNELNQTLPRFLPHACFRECFLHLGHYRRAITLMVEMERLQRERLPLTRADLARFTVDFDSPQRGDEGLLSANGLSPIADGIFQLATLSSERRPKFEEIVTLYTAAARRHFEPRGLGEHFRRIIPLRWPRAFHYELYDYGGEVGAEIHLESDEVRVLKPELARLQERVALHLPEGRVDFDATWYENAGRLRVLFSEDTPPERVAAAMLALIEETFPDLDAAVRNSSFAYGGTINGKVT